MAQKEAGKARKVGEGPGLGGSVVGHKCRQVLAGDRQGARALEFLLLMRYLTPAQLGRYHTATGSTFAQPRDKAPSFPFLFFFFSPVFPSGRSSLPAIPPLPGLSRARIWQPSAIGLPPKKHLKASNTRTLLFCSLFGLFQPERLCLRPCALVVSPFSLSYSPPLPSSSWRLSQKAQLLSRRLKQNFGLGPEQTAEFH